MMLERPNDNSSTTPADEARIGTVVDFNQAAVDSAQPNLAQLSTVTTREVEWLWPGRVPLGAITMLSGDPGVSKSFLTLDIAARVSNGEEWPDGGANEPGSAIVMSAEDDWGTTVCSRLRWLDAKPDRIRGMNSWPFELGRDLPKLAENVEALGDCRLVVIDPVTAFLGNTSENANTQVRTLLAPLAELAATRRLAVVLTSHLRKKGGPALYQTLGCQSFVALARATWNVKYDPQDTDRRILFSPKRNLGPNPGGLAFRIVSMGQDKGAFIDWEDDVVDVPNDGTEPELLSANRPAIRQQIAVEWLRWFLAAEEKPAQEVKLAGAGYGFSEGTLRRARCELGVKTVKSGGKKHGCWLWRLPKELPKG
jgi:hypothetical protein